jgi:hypothetical protein
MAKGRINLLSSTFFEIPKSEILIPPRLSTAEGKCLVTLHRQVARTVLTKYICSFDISVYNIVLVQVG